MLLGLIAVSMILGGLGMTVGGLSGGGAILAGGVIVAVLLEIAAHLAAIRRRLDALAQYGLPPTDRQA